VTTLTLQTADQQGLDAADLRDLMHAVTETAQRLQGELAGANEQLRRSRSLAALGEMAAGIAHEIRNPLASIQLYAQMLGEDLGDRPEQSSLCTRIESGVRGIDAIVRDVLAFARDRHMDPVAIDASMLLDRALEPAQAQCRRHDVRIDRSACDPFTLTVDATLMTQALANIVRNAIDAMVESEDERVLEISVAAQRVRCPDGVRRRHIVVRVGDTGTGIPDEALERLFNPFFTTRATGTGLGLAITHRIVDAHGGHIHVERRATGGTAFEIRLPPDGPPASLPLETALITTTSGVHRRVAETTQ
jgi:signal transduction histidine kinase